jgi:hypothetical protein
VIAFNLTAKKSTTNIEPPSTPSTPRKSTKLESNGNWAGEQYCGMIFGNFADYWKLALMSESLCAS